MPEAVIVAAARTPIGRSNKGAMVDVDAFGLAQTVIEAVIGRSGINTADLDDIVMAESLQGGGVIARNVAVRLGLDHVPGLADNRHCAAGLSALQIAAGSIRSGMDRVIIAGGTESLSSMPRVLKSTPASARDYQPWMSESHPATPEAPSYDMSITVGENTAAEAGISRGDADVWAWMSHQRAATGIASGWFADEIVPVALPGGGVCDTDEQPRPDTTLEKLGQLKLLNPDRPGAVVTAGNSAGLNDAAAAVLVVSSDYAQAHGLTPLARIISWSSSALAPARTGFTPGIAIPKALDRAGMKLGDVDLFEVNEAFCTVAVATSRQLGIDHAIMNVNGSGCGLGHPIAATGTRMVVTMVNELRRRERSVGCVAMCAGGGMGSALVFEVL